MNVEVLWQNMRKKTMNLAHVSEREVAMTVS